MSKWDGWMEVPLEVSQVKQIAGRAGRYSMVVEGGLVTTLEPSDLPLLRAAIDTKPEPLRHARVGFMSSTIMDIFEALPCGSTVTTARDALLFCSVLPPSMAVMDPNAKEAETMRYIDSFSQDLTFTERALMLQCPFPSMDDQFKAIMGLVLSSYQNRFSVDLREILLKSGLLTTLEQVLVSKQTKGILPKPRLDLASLETLHSVLTVYAWLSLRNSIAFYAYDLAVALRKATQEAMDYCLESISTSSLIQYPHRTLGSQTQPLHVPLTPQASTPYLYVSIFLLIDSHTEVVPGHSRRWRSLNITSAALIRACSLGAFFISPLPSLTVAGVPFEFPLSQISQLLSVTITHSTSSHGWHYHPIPTQLRHQQAGRGPYFSPKGQDKGGVH